MDHVRLAENEAMTRNNTLNIEHARDCGIEADVLEEWFYGLELAGHETAPHYNIPDYPSVQSNPGEAAKELDRLTAAGKIYWYADDAVPADLDIGPTTLILKGSRARLVHDWTRAGLNQHLVAPATNSTQWTTSSVHCAPTRTWLVWTYEIVSFTGQSLRALGGDSVCGIL